MFWLKVRRKPKISSQVLLRHSFVTFCTFHRSLLEFFFSRLRISESLSDFGQALGYFANEFSRFPLVSPPNCPLREVQTDHPTCLARYLPFGWGIKTMNSMAIRTNIFYVYVVLFPSHSSSFLASLLLAISPEHDGSEVRDSSRPSPKSPSNSWARGQSSLRVLLLAHCKHPSHPRPRGRKKARDMEIKSIPLFRGSRDNRLRILSLARSFLFLSFSCSLGPIRLFTTGRIHIVSLSVSPRKRNYGTPWKHFPPDAAASAGPGEFKCNLA